MVCYHSSILEINLKKTSFEQLLMVLTVWSVPFSTHLSSRNSVVTLKRIFSEQNNKIPVDNIVHLQSTYRGRVETGGAYTTTLLVLIDRAEGGIRETPPPSPILTRLGWFYHCDGKYARRWPLPRCVYSVGTISPPPPCLLYPVLPKGRTKQRKRTADGQICGRNLADFAEKGPKRSQTS